MVWDSHLSVLCRDGAFETQINRLLDEAIRSVGDWASVWAPECNVFETDAHFCVKIALPGVDVNHLEARVERHVLFVKGNRQVGTTEGGAWYAREMTEGPFACSFQLPSYVDQDRSTASYSQGILTIRFPKRAEAKPRSIMIESQEGMPMQPNWWKRWWRRCAKTCDAWLERASWPVRRLIG